MRALSVDRFSDALYTPTEVARYLSVPSETMRRWVERTADGARTEVRPVVTSIPARRGYARIPFIGLAEAYTLRAIRDAGVPLQRIRPALEALDREFGIAHALASQHLYTDGAEVLVDIARGLGSEMQRAATELVVIRNGQRVFADVVQDYLRRVTFSGGYAQTIPLPAYFHAGVIVDPSIGFGQPVFAASGARLADALELFEAGETMSAVSAEFGIPYGEFEEAMRIALRTAA